MNVKQERRQINVGVFAHVDAGKTTLAEGILYKTGVISRPGRVDNGDTSLDTEQIEKAKGITVFSKQAAFDYGGVGFTILDTPGHMDFSSEMERTLNVIDCAVLVISGTAMVQSHTLTLWELLKEYGLPVFVFVSKMDLPTADAGAVFSMLKTDLGDGFVDFTSGPDPELLAECDEELFDKYISSPAFDDIDVMRAVERRNVFPVFFGSGLRLEGIDSLLDGLVRYSPVPMYREEFSARVFKTGTDPKGERLTFLKLTGGSLSVRQGIEYKSIDGSNIKEKVSQIRIYSGAKYAQVKEIPCGTVCAVTGLSGTYPGQGLGTCADSPAPRICPALIYRMLLPEGSDPLTVMSDLRRLREEDPALDIRWDSRLGEITVRLMGKTQAEILKSLINQRFGYNVDFDTGSIEYRETIAGAVEGAGHFEPLRHYAEVHLRLEPLPPGTGLVISSECSEDSLSLNWQRLIMTHLAEKEHIGVLTGSPITDIKIILTAGRAHLKHTEGGDFRQATYRAVRQGLMKAKSILLEPYYDFTLEIPAQMTGRAVNDIRAMAGRFECRQKDERVTEIRGSAPVDAMRDYMTQVVEYTGGKGRFSFRFSGFEPCHNEHEVVEKLGYDPGADLDNTPDSVFCSHGAGVIIKWDKADSYMHLESASGRKDDSGPELRRYNLDLDEKELEEIMLREFGPIKRPMYLKPDSVVKEQVYTPNPKREYLLVDGYNLIFAWPELRDIADRDMGSARIKLADILASYCSYTGSKLALIFDGYAEKDNPGSKFEHHGINVVYTKHGHTADMYIEKLTGEIGRNYSVRVVTSDNLIRLSALRSGVLRTASADFTEEVNWVYEKIREIVKSSSDKDRDVNPPIIKPLKKVPAPDETPSDE